MSDLTPERLQQVLFDSAAGFVGQPFDPEQMKKAMMAAALAVMPADFLPAPIIETSDGDYRAEFIVDENGMPAVKLTPVVYAIEITVSPNEVGRP